jgi:hypothetical protein
VDGKHTAARSVIVAHTASTNATPFSADTIVWIRGALDSFHDDFGCDAFFKSLFDDELAEIIVDEMQSRKREDADLNATRLHDGRLAKGDRPQSWLFGPQQPEHRSARTSLSNQNGSWGWGAGISLREVNRFGYVPL